MATHSDHFDHPIFITTIFSSSKQVFDEQNVYTLAQLMKENENIANTNEK